MSGGWNPAKVAAFEKAFWGFVRHARINSKEKGGNFRIADGLYEGQKRYLRAIFDGLAQDKHDFKFLKSRQLGISTISELLVTFWLGFHDGMQGAMVFDTASHSAAARVRIKNIFTGLPSSFGFPEITKDNREGFILANGSVLQFMSAGVRESRSSGVLGRSLGLNLLWCSEVCSWENTEGIAALLNSLSSVYPDRLYVWESTARGFNHWHDMWIEAKANDLDQVATFIGWWAKDDQRIERSDSRWALYGEAPPNEREQKRIREVAELYDYQVSQEQLAWYRWRSDPNLEDDESDPDDPNFLQDQPWTEHESFQQPGISFFRSDRLAEATRIASQERFLAYRFWAGNNFVECDVRKATTWREIELKVWEEPQSESVYVVSTDPAFGRDEENANSCIQVLRCYADAVEQVAEFASATIEPHHLSWLMLTLLGWYGMPHQNQVLNICELNGPGEEVWRQFNQTVTLIKQGYLRLSAREKGIADIGSNVRNYIYTRSDAMGAGAAWQFKTNAQTKVQMMEAFRNYWHNGLVLLRSTELVEEMRTVTRKGDEIGAPSGKRDDRNFAMAMGVRGWEERMRRELIVGHRTREADQARRMRSVPDMIRLYNTNVLEDFFARKRQSRRMAALNATYRSRF